MDAQDTCMTPWSVYILESAGEPLSKPPGTEKVAMHIQEDQEKQTGL